MSFLDALIPGSQKYDIYAKSVQLPIKTVTLPLDGGGPLIANPATTITVKVGFVGQIEVYTLPQIFIPTADVVAVPPVNAPITITVPDASSHITVSQLYAYRSDPGARYVFGLAVKAANSNVISLYPNSSSGFEKPDPGDSIEIAGFTTVGIAF